MHTKGLKGHDSLNLLSVLKKITYMYVGTHAHSHTYTKRVRKQVWHNVSNWKIWMIGLSLFFFFGKCEILKLKKLLKRLAAHSQKSLFIPEDFLKEI